MNHEKFLIVYEGMNPAHVARCSILESFPKAMCFMASTAASAMLQLRAEVGFTAIVTCYRKSLDGFAIAREARRLHPESVILMTSLLQDFEATAKGCGIDRVIDHSDIHNVGAIIQDVLLKRLDS